MRECEDKNPTVDNRNCDINDDHDDDNDMSSILVIMVITVMEVNMMMVN